MTILSTNPQNLDWKQPWPGKNEINIVGHVKEYIGISGLENYRMFWWKVFKV